MGKTLSNVIYSEIFGQNVGELRNKLCRNQNAEIDEMDEWKYGKKKKNKKWVHTQDLEVPSIKEDKIRRIKLDGLKTYRGDQLSVPVRSVVFLLWPKQTWTREIKKDI